jgi:hypothetical protein
VKRLSIRRPAFNEPEAVAAYIYAFTFRRDSGDSYHCACYCVRGSGWDS